MLPPRFEPKPKTLFLNETRVQQWLVMCYVMAVDDDDDDTIH